MYKILVVDYGNFEFVSFNEAVDTLANEYGYEGSHWDEIVGSMDFQKLCDFLLDDGINVELI